MLVVQLVRIWRNCGWVVVGSRRSGSVGSGLSSGRAVGFLSCGLESEQGNEIRRRQLCGNERLQHSAPLCSRPTEDVLTETQRQRQRLLHAEQSRAGSVHSELAPPLLSLLHRGSVLIMVGFGGNRRGGRLPSLVLIGLMVLIAVLSYNYWTVTRQHGRAVDELAEVQAQVKRTDAARSRLEKRNSELMLQVDTHRRQIDQKEGDYTVLESKLQARDVLVKKCGDEKMKLQNDLSLQTSEINQLKEQVKDLRQEVVRQEEQLKELKRNNTNLERKMEYESLQCGRQIAQLKNDYEESKKIKDEKTATFKQNSLNANKSGAVAVRGTESAKAHQPDALQQHDPDLKEEMGKPGSDAGMPGIEDSEVGKQEDLHFALKKPAITQNQIQSKVLQDKQAEGHEQPRIDVGNKPGLDAGDGFREGDGAGVGDGLNAGVEAGVEVEMDADVDPGAAGIGDGVRFNEPHGLPLDRPDLPQNGAASRDMRMQSMHPQPEVPQPVVDRPVVLDENNKADEFGEQQRQLRDPDGQGAALPPPPPNPVQVLPNPIEPQRNALPVAPLRHRQNDEDREVPGDRAVDYGKRHQAIDIL